MHRKEEDFPFQNHIHMYFYHFWLPRYRVLKWDIQDSRLNGVGPGARERTRAGGLATRHAPVGGWLAEAGGWLVG